MKTKMKAAEVFWLAAQRLGEVPKLRKKNRIERIQYHERKHAKYNASWLAKVFGKIDPIERTDREMYAKWREGWLPGEGYLVGVQIPTLKDLYHGTMRLNSDAEVTVSLEDAELLTTPLIDDE